MPDTLLTPERRAIVERAAGLGPSFLARSADHDREASFPTANWADLAEAGLLGICIPESAGGLGGDFVAYALASEELGRHCPATALTYNMHVATTLLAGQIADDLVDDADDLRILHANRELLWEGIVQRGVIHSQPFSETTSGEKAGFSTRAVPVDGGYRVTGRKIFASLSGAADVHNVVAVVEGDDRNRLLGVPADAEGVTIEGDWDPLGMRATDSRTLVLDGAFVPAENEWIPPGTFDAVRDRWPYFYMTLSFSYLGLMRAVLDATAAYLTGSGSGEGRRDHPGKQQGWAEMNLAYSRAQGLCYHVLGEVGPDPGPDAVRRALSSTVTTMDGAVEVASMSLRVCGGRSLLRPSRLEQLFRDARCGAAMRPWSVENCLERLGRTGLYDDEDAT